MVLDALIWIKNKIDPTLTFRRSCREGVCGSCAMNIDGTNTLACTKGMDEINGAVKIYPLPHMPVVKDLVPDLTQLLRAARLDRAVAADRDAGAREGMEAEPRGPRRSSTASTSASCAPAARPRARAIGGTATAISARRPCCRPTAGSIDSRDEATGERLDNLEDPFRLYRCHTIMNCAQGLPEGPQSGQGDRRDQEDDGGTAGVILPSAVRTAPRPVLPGCIFINLPVRFALDCDIKRTSFDSGYVPLD